MKKKPIKFITHEKLMKPYFLKDKSLKAKVEAGVKRLRMMTEKRLSVHPGDVLLEEFLVPFGITQSRLAKEIHVPVKRISKIIHGKKGISADTALRLSRYFGNTAMFWLTLQMNYDLAIEKKQSQALIEKSIKPMDRID